MGGDDSCLLFSLLFFPSTPPPSPPPRFGLGKHRYTSAAASSDEGDCLFLILAKRKYYERFLFALPWGKKTSFGLTFELQPEVWEV